MLEALSSKFRDMDYPNEDESFNAGLCTGLEDNVEDIIYGTVSKTIGRSHRTMSTRDHILSI